MASQVSERNARMLFTSAGLSMVFSDAPNDTYASFFSMPRGDSKEQRSSPLARESCAFALAAAVALALNTTRIAAAVAAEHGLD